MRVGLARIGAHPQAGSKVLKRLDGVRNRLPGGRRVLRPSLAVRQVTRAAAAAALRHQTCGTVLDDRQHRRVVAGKPVDHFVAVAHVHERIRGGASRNGAGFGLFCLILVGTQISVRRRLRIGLVARLGLLAVRVRPQRLRLSLRLNGCHCHRDKRSSDETENDAHMLLHCDLQVRLKPDTTYSRQGPAKAGH